jgi:hypothetical protein
VLALGGRISPSEGLKFTRVTRHHRPETVPNLASSAVVENSVALGSNLICPISCFSSVLYNEFRKIC